MTVHIGITGPPASGKELLKNYLITLFKNRGISSYYWSISNDVRVETARIYGEYTREKLTSVSKDLKERFGPDIMAVRAYAQIMKLQNLPDVTVIEAIKSSSEIKYFRGQWGNSFVLLGVNAPIEILIDRVISRKRYDEDISVLLDSAATRKMIDAEYGIHSSLGFDIGRCLELCDYAINNVGSIADLEQEAEKFLTTVIVPFLK